MNNVSVFEIIFILGSLACIQYSVYGWVKVTATLLLMIYLIIAKVRMRNKRLTALRALEQKITIDEVYKEKNNSYIIYGIAF
ncbi:MAG TPA: hypothetical protein DCY20_02910, partial [Firmicutes bacterium]|nr:hypothetical protein [Bacillota bacterium]